MLWLMVTLAMADPCADPARELSQAVLAFEDAEVEQAQQRVDAALSALDCVDTPVTSQFIADLYGFDAVVAYSLADDRRTTTALQRLYIAAPHAPMHALFGPELVERAMAWHARLGPADSDLTLVSGPDTWVDGVALASDQPLRVVAGRHLVQTTTAAGFVSEYVVVRGPTGLIIGDSVVVQVAPPTSTAAVADATGTTGVPVPAQARKKRHRTGLLLAGLVTAAAGGGTLAYAWQAEGSFNKSPFDAATYGGCGIADACYSDARVDAIQGQATQVRVAYIVGYGLTALGIGIVGTELLILPAPRTGGGQVGLRGTF